MRDSIKNRAAAAGDEGVSFEGLEQEALLDGSMNFSSDGIQATLNILSWLRVYTLNQVALGAVLGFIFSIFWFWLWDAIVMKAFIAHFWVRVVAFVGAAGLCVGFLLRNWIIEDLH